MTAELHDITPRFSPARTPACPDPRPTRWSFGDRVMGEERGRVFRGHVQLVSVGSGGCVGVRVFDGPEAGTLKIKQPRDLAAHLGRFT